MITYQYQCTTCNNQLEAAQSIKSKPLVHCDECGQDTLERVICGGLAVFVDNGPSTLEGLADRNTKKMGHYELQEKRYAEKENKAASRNAAQEELARKYGSTPITYKPEDVAKSDKINKINKMTPEQKVKYIEKGE